MCREYMCMMTGEWGWSINSNKLAYNNNKIVDKKQTTISKEDRIKLRAENYYEKILQKSNHTIVAINYTGSKDNVDAICVACGHKWKIRADHLANRCWCPICKKKKITNLSRQEALVNYPSDF